MKTFAIAVCCAVLGFTGQAQADNLSQETLAAMGLGGATVVTDAEANEVRGMGFMGGRKSRHKYGALALGGSIAYVGSEYAGAGSANVYAAKGEYGASGSNFSEAGKTITNTKTIKSKGQVIKKTIHSKSIYVYAGGSSQSMQW